MKKDIKKTKSTHSQKLILIVIFLVFVLASVQLIISHRLATAGEDIRQFEEKTAILKQENRLLEEDINKITSLNIATSKAEAIGFRKFHQVLHLKPQLPVALK